MAMVIALAPDPQWRLDRCARLAHLDQDAGRWDQAACRWEEIESTADHARPVEAQILWEAADFHSERGEQTATRSLLDRVAPTLHDADAYQELAENQAWSAPRDQRAALGNFDRALKREPHEGSILDGKARVLLWTSDSTLFDPVGAYKAACRAVREDPREPDFHQTLAWAQFALGRREEAIASIRLGLSLRRKDRTDFTQDLRVMRRSRLRGDAPWITLTQRDRWMQEHYGFD
jgi:tetratricopeptide (TPR) repeat protein